MLTPEYLDGLPEPVLSLYAEAEEEILCDMARRISTYDYWIPAADWQYQKMLETGRTREDIIATLSSKTGRSQEELRQLMQQAANDSLRVDEAIYRAAGAAGPSIAESAALKNILNAGFKLTNQTFRNLTRTTANTASQQFEHALDKAWLKVQSGAFSVDAAVQSAVKELCAQGVGSIKYPSGRIDTLETAVRRAVVTGVNQTCGQLQLERAREMGCDLMELTAHAGARPEHAEWQGQIVSLSGQPGYLSLEDIGYGDVAGFKGANCRHDWNPYFEGMPRTWTDKKLRELNEPKYEYNGKKLTEYEARQQQRYNERQIRRWKRENLAMNAAGQDTTESAVKLKEWQEKQNDFLDQTGLKRQQSREQVAGFGRSEASAASAAAREYYGVWSKSMGVDDAIKTLANYYDVKYNDSPRYELLRRYVQSVDAGRLSSLSGFGLYEQYYNRIESELVGTTVGQTTITGQSQHFLERVFGCMRDPKTGRPRSGVELEDIFDCVNNPVNVLPIRGNAEGDRSFVVVGHRAKVSVDPDNGLLIQTNPWRA